MASQNKRALSLFSSRVLLFGVWLLCAGGGLHAAPAVTSANPNAIKLIQGKTATVLLKGKRLNTIKGATLSKDRGGKRSIGNIRSTFSGRSAVGRLMLVLKSELAPGKYFIHINDGTKHRVLLPVTAHVAKASRVRKPNYLDGAKPRNQGGIRREPARTSRAKPRPEGLVATPTQRRAVTRRDAFEDRQGGSVRGPVPVANRIKLLSFTINEGAEEVSDRLVNIQASVKNGPIRAFRICETSSRQEERLCDIASKPWQTTNSPNFSYLLNTPNSNNKTLHLQVRGHALSGTAIRNTQIDNFSTQVSSTIRYQMAPALTLTPSIKRQFAISRFNFAIEGIRAERLEATLRLTAGTGCHFGHDADYQAEVNKTSPTSFEFVITDYAYTTSSSNQCSASLRVLAYDANDQRMDHFLTRYTQEFLPYDSRIITLENTFDLYQKLLIKEEMLWGGGQGFAVCGGSSIGISGVKKLGIYNEGGDLAIQTRSSPVGRSCEYSMNAGVKSGWLIKMNFEEIKEGRKCEVSRDGQPKHIAPMVLALTRDKRYIGWESVNNVFNKWRGGGVNPFPSNSTSNRLRIFLTCSSAASNNHGVKSILRSVEFEVPPNAPEDATWRDAFF